MSVFSPVHCRYGLAWNPTSAGEGHLLSASEDTTVCHWCVFSFIDCPLFHSSRIQANSVPSQTPNRDIKGYTKSNSVLEPLRVYRGHTAVVEDVAWKPDVDNVFASVGDDRQLILWVPVIVSAPSLL